MSNDASTLMSLTTRDYEQLILIGSVLVNFILINYVIILLF